MKGIYRFFNYLRPPGTWLIAVNITLALVVGLSFYMFYVAKAGSYLSDDPKTCVNCHVMAPEYATWEKSAHSKVTNCNDCHVPHDNALKKYSFKAKDGLYHAYVFTTRSEPQAIIMKEAGIQTVQENCIRCHSEVNDRVKTNRITREMNLHGEGKLCWDCHRETPHGRTRSQSAAPNANIPVPESPVPDWIKQNNSKK